MRTISTRWVVALTGLALATALALAGCATSGNGGGAYGGSNSGGGSVAVNLSCASGATVCTKDVAIGGAAKTVLASTSGMTLYYFTQDTATSSACTGGCGQTWPALTVNSSTVTGTSLSGTLVTLSDANGTQVEYNGHPLYTYSGDHAKTDATGDGVGGSWYAAYPGLAAAGRGGGGGY